MGTFEDANELATLFPGNNPKWTELTSLDNSTIGPTFSATAVTGAPSSATSGQKMDGGVESGDTALQCLVHVDLRVMAKPPGVAGDTNPTDPPLADDMKVHRRSARFAITTFDTTAEYTITIGGAAGTTAAQPYADVPAALAAIKAAVDAAAGGVVTTTLVDADGDTVDDSLLIEGIAEADYTIDAVSVTAAGAVAMVADPASAALRLWFTDTGVQSSGNPRPPGWRHSNGGAFTIPDYRGFLERFEVGGLRRIHLEVHTVVGVAGDLAPGGALSYAYRAFVGPGIRPGEQV